MKPSLCFLILSFAASTRAHANRIEVATLPVSPSISGYGWRSDSISPTLQHGSYSTGWAAYNGTPALTRGFLIFDLMRADANTPSNYAVVTAQLEFRRVGYESPDATETLGIFDVNTSPAAVGSKFVGDPAIFEDLGTGRLYASAELSAATPTWALIDLNRAAIRDINVHYGGLFAVGLSLLSARPDYVANERVFAAAGAAATLKLLIAPVPEPSGSIIALGLLATPLIRQRRRR